MLAIWLAGGCSGSNPANGAPDAGAALDTGVVGCGGTPDTYVANLKKAGELGKYTFTLVQATPAPPSLQVNEWTLTVTDATGASPDVSQLTVYPYMPLMGHPSTQTPQITVKGDGTFDAKDVDLFMPGLWTVTVSVNAPAGDAGPPAVLDKAVYMFCVG